MSYTMSYTSLQKIANVIPTAAVKQSTKDLGPLVNTLSYIQLKENALAASAFNS